MPDDIYTTAAYVNTNNMPAANNRWIDGANTTTGYHNWLNGTINVTDPLDLNDYNFHLDTDWVSPVTRRDLDDLAKRLYNIIINHTKVDIDEDEFMRLLKGD